MKIYIFVTDDGETQLSRYSRGWGLDVECTSIERVRSELKSYGHETGVIDKAMDELRDKPEIWTTVTI